MANTKLQKLNSYSGEKIQKAGKAFREWEQLSESEFDSVMDILSFWRHVHEFPLQNAMETLQRITNKHDKKALFARRMKRFDSIHRKLTRFETMSLYKMQDIGGCRVIVSNQKVLKKILFELKRMPEFKIKGGKAKINDYIQSPKSDGYRSIHIVGKFPDVDGKMRFIEIQLRTPIQHHWATAVEIVDLFTKQSLKTNQGSRDWKSLFKEVSTQFEIMERIKNFDTLMIEKRYTGYVRELHRHYGDKQLYDATSVEYKTLKKCYNSINSLNVIQLMEGFAQSIQWVDEDMIVSDEDGYVLITIDFETKKMTAIVFSQGDANKAELAYIEEEKKASKNKKLVAMVATPNIGDLKIAYPNYFADSSEFIKYLLIVDKSYSDLRLAVHNYSP